MISAALRQIRDISVFRQAVNMLLQVETVITSHRRCIKDRSTCFSLEYLIFFTAYLSNVPTLCQCFTAIASQSITVRVRKADKESNSFIQFSLFARSTEKCFQPIYVFNVSYSGKIFQRLYSKFCKKVI